MALSPSHRGNAKEVGMQRIVAAAFLMVLAACASEPRRIAESPPTVSYSFTDDDSLDEAGRKAQDYCDNYDLDARLLDVDKRSTDNVAHFECR
jgi:hypothetical protein